MLAAYGVDVLDPAVSTRRVAVLLERLPPYARRFGEQWSTEAELLAVLADHLAALTWVTMRAHGAKNVPKPRPLPRPGLRDTHNANRVTRDVSVRQPLSSDANAGSWADAARQLAGMPGVQVTRDG
jgi:hypothetical protein